MGHLSHFNQTHAEVNVWRIAYSYDADTGFMSWGGNLIDIQQFSNGGLDLYVCVAYIELDIDYICGV